ncbi:MAG: 2'-5' RNA ligase family protein [Solobacterium sp.]|nr:2'-5' RNA ligase family protein [Solobacterium sp.]MBR0477894.1 2'-5' RNA ligase family protein [Solobacterium sp.]
MDNKALYILAGYDDLTENRLADMQNRLYDRGFVGTHTRNIPQHITLGSFPVDQEQELIDLVQKTAEATLPFQVVFNHIGIFPGGKVLFIAPDINRALLELKERFGDSHGWTPHTTMLIDEPDIILKALPEVIQDFSALEGTVSSLLLYEFFPRRHILSVELKG